MENQNASTEAQKIPDTKPTSETKETGAKESEKQVFDQAHIEKLLAEREKEHTKKLEAAIEEEREKAKLSEKERMDYENKKREEELQARERAIERKELEASTAKLLVEKAIPTELTDYVAGADLKETISRVEAFKKIWDEAVAEQVKKQLGGKTPRLGDSSSGTQSDIKSQIAKILGIKKEV